MKGKWTIKKQSPMPGIEYWQVYRVRDVEEPHHSGNEETYGPLCGTREEAEKHLKDAANFEM